MNYSLTDRATTWIFAFRRWVGYSLMRLARAIYQSGACLVMGAEGARVLIAFADTAFKAAVNDAADKRDQNHNR